MLYIYGVNKKFYLYVTYFMSYSFLGWLIETVYVSLQKGSIAFRGFLFGPFCPVYGFGALAVLICTKKVQWESIGVLLEMPFIFVIGSLVTTILEYITAFIMETLTREKLWDYSNEYFNLNGRICLKITIAWGFISLFLIYVLQPFLIKLLKHLDEKALYLLTSLNLIYIISDTIVSISNTTNIQLIHNLISFFIVIV